MAGPDQRENLPDREKKISVEERGQLAHNLIKKFNNAIKSLPEFSQALVDLYFYEYMSMSSNNPLDGRISFQKNGYIFDFRYRKGKEVESLEISKNPPDDKEGWWSESVSLHAFTDKRTNQFMGGSLQYSLLTDSSKNYPTNTGEAIEKIEEFFAANFGSTSSA